ncbi:MAG: adenylate/guanylate cyclase domain-containing protein [Chloroflexota bacterium]|nr:adenylate/guanylate cyclase domain-containing protein [Chloroflexota bacterium]
MARLLNTLGSIGANPNDEEDLRVRKRFLVLCSIFVLPPSVLWGLFYLASGEPLAASIPLGYVAISALSIVVFAIRREFRVLRAVQLFLILALPFLLQETLGGFVPSSAVILWSMLCPFGALVFSNVRAASRWFGLFVVLVVVSALFQFRTSNNLRPELVTLLFVLNVSVVASIVFVLLASFVRQIESEHARAESLLLNVLPKAIAWRLKAAPGIIADAYDDATILFADVVNSTPLTSSLSARDMVALLDEYVTHFDAMARRYGVEKIRTIGDNWMGVAGVPTARADHARCAARLALEMLSFVHERKAGGARCLDFRIGLNSGPVIGGVIGRDKFVFDIWGDAVNLASRMESTGVPGRIQVGPATYELLKDDFEFEARGSVTVKGRGETETWFLISQASPTSPGAWKTASSPNAPMGVAGSVPFKGRAVPGHKEQRA